MSSFSNFTANFTISAISNFSIRNNTSNTTTTTAATTTTTKQPVLSVENWILISSLLLVAFVGMIGNGFVCYFFGWKRRGAHRSVPDKLFFYLGIVDFLSSFFNPLLFLYFEFTQYKRWDFHLFGCKLLVPLGPISTTLSSFLIQIIAIDRYFVILSPFGRRYSGKRVDHCVIAAIFLSVAIYWFYFWMLVIPPSGTCRVLDVTDQRYAVPMVSTMLVMDLMFISVMLFTSISIVRKLANDMKENTLGIATQQHKNHKRLVCMLIVLACVFFVLVLPRDLLQLSFTFSWLFPPGMKYNVAIKRINTIVKIMSTANSCANVFIYSKMHKNFRFAISRIFCCFPANLGNQNSHEVPMLNKSSETTKTSH
eukprot:gene11419-12609_t